MGCEEEPSCNKVVDNEEFDLHESACVMNTCDSDTPELTGSAQVIIKLILDNVMYRNLSQMLKTRVYGSLCEEIVSALGIKVKIKI